MNLNITGRHMDLSEGLKAAAQSMADRLPRFFNRINHVEVVFDEDHNQILAEIIVSTVQGKTIVGKAEDYDPYKSLNQASSKVTRQLKKLKEKLQGKRGEPDQSSPANPAERERPGEELPDEQL